jgi:hypothetical protein
MRRLCSFTRHLWSFGGWRLCNFGEWWRPWDIGECVCATLEDWFMTSMQLWRVTSVRLWRVMTSVRHWRMITSVQLWRNHDASPLQKGAACARAKERVKGRLKARVKGRSKGSMASACRSACIGSQLWTLLHRIPSDLMGTPTDVSARTAKHTSAPEDACSLDPSGSTSVTSVLNALPTHYAKILLIIDHIWRNIEGI